MKTYLCLISSVNLQNIRNKCKLKPPFLVNLNVLLSFYALLLMLSNLKLMENKQQPTIDSSSPRDSISFDIWYDLVLCNLRDKI